MIIVDNDVAQIIESSSRTFLSRFTHNGNVISGDVMSVAVHKGSCGDSEFAPGAVFSSYADATIENCTDYLENKELVYQIGVVLDENNTTKWHDIGYFTVHKPSTSAHTTSFTALGRISSKMGAVYVSKLTFPTSIQNVLNEIEADTGVPIDASEFNTALQIETKPVAYTYREMIAYIAGLFFGFATENSEGIVVFGKYNTANSTISTDGDRTTTMPTFTDLDTEVTGVKVVVSFDNNSAEETDSSEVSFSYGTVNVSVNNPFMTQEIFNANIFNVIGLKYRSGTIPISLGDFRIEPFDCLMVTDIAGKTYALPCMDIIHTFDGGISTQIIAPGLKDDLSDDSFRGPLARAVERYAIKTMQVEELAAGKISAEDLEAKLGIFKEIITEYIIAEVADIGYVKADEIEAKLGEFNFLQADFSNLKEAEIDKAKINELFIASGYFQETVTETGVVFNLTGVHIDAGDITTGSLSTDRLNLKGEDGLYYQLNITSLGETYISQLTPEEQLELQDHIHAKTILAHSITTDELALQIAIGANAYINFDDGTMNLGGSLIWDGEELEIDGDVLVDGSIASKKIDVEDLFAQDITTISLNASSVHFGMDKGAGGDHMQLDLTKKGFDLTSYVNNSTNNGVQDGSGSLIHILNGDVSLKSKKIVIGGFIAYTEYGTDLNYSIDTEEILINADSDISIAAGSVKINNAEFGNINTAGVFHKCGRCVTVDAWGEPASSVLFTLGSDWRPANGNGTFGGWCKNTSTGGWYPCVGQFDVNGIPTCYALTSFGATDTYAIFNTTTDRRNIFELYVTGSWNV